MPVKFRCYRCNQLLGVSRTKVGAVISCPKCGSALVVPDPDDESTPVARSVRPVLGAFTNATAQDSESLINLRPEDIRVEPGIEILSSSTDDEAEAEAQAEAEEGVLEPPPGATDEAVPGEEAPGVLVQPSGPPVPAATAAVVPPPIQVETPGAARSYESYGRSRARDVVLPRSVVLAWSLLVLMAVALAFGAGLLAGHFVWRVHEPASRLIATPPAG